MKNTKAYKSIPILIGLNPDIQKNRVRFFSCYFSPLDARFENPNKFIVQHVDFLRSTFFYIPMSFGEIQKSYLRGEMPNRLIFSEDQENYEKCVKESR